MKKNKYQQLNKFELLNYNTNEKDEMLINNIKKRMFIIMLKKNNQTKIYKHKKRLKQC